MPAAGFCRPPSSGPCLLAKRREACRLRHGPKWHRSARKARTRRGTHRQRRSRKSPQGWLPTSATGLGARLLHLHRDWARSKSSPIRSAWYTWERRCARLATGLKRLERHGRAHDTTYNVSTWQYGAQHRRRERPPTAWALKARRLPSNSEPTAQRIAACKRNSYDARDATCNRRLHRMRHAQRHTAQTHACKPRSTRQGCNMQHATYSRRLPSGGDPLAPSAACTRTLIRNEPRHMCAG